MMDKKAIKLASPGVAKSSLIAPFKKVLIQKISNKKPVENPVNISKDPMLKSNRKY